MITDTTPSSAGGDGPLPASSAAAAAAAAVACPSLLDALAAPRAYDTTGGGSHAALAAPQAARATRSKRGGCTAALAARSPATALMLRCHTQGEASGAAGDGAAGEGAAAAHDSALGGSDAPLDRSSPAPAHRQRPRTGGVGQLRLLAILTILRTVV